MVRAGALAAMLAWGACAHAEPAKDAAAASPPLQVDLGRVTSKYIGETEKNLNRTFDSAESSGAVLQQDDADALFARKDSAAAPPQQTETKSSARVRGRQTVKKKDPP
jgi:hypothetical protein